MSSFWCSKIQSARLTYLLSTWVVKVGTKKYQACSLFSPTHLLLVLCIQLEQPLGSLKPSDYLTAARCVVIPCNSVPHRNAPRWAHLDMKLHVPVYGSLLTLQLVNFHIYLLWYSCETNILNCRPYSDTVLPMTYNIIYLETSAQCSQSGAWDVFSVNHVTRPHWTNFCKVKSALEGRLFLMRPDRLTSHLTY